MYRFLVICYILLFTSGELLAATNTTSEAAPPPLPAGAPPLPAGAPQIAASDHSPQPITTNRVSEEKTLENKTFIEKGDVNLPVSPEILRPQQDLALPPPPQLELPTLPKTPEKKSLDDKHIAPHDANIKPVAPTSTQPQVAAPHVSSPPAITQPTAPIHAVKAVQAIPESKLKGEVLQKNFPIEQIKPKQLPPPPAANNAPLPPHPMQEVVAPTPTLAKAKKEKEIDPLQIRFIRDESILLLFEDDEIVLGKLTERAKLDQMDGTRYLKLYMQSLEDEKNSKLAKKNLWFIMSHSKVEPIMLPKKYLLKTSIGDIESSNLTDLRVLADNYHILDMIDKNGNSLLHIATFNDNPAITKWLIMRNIDINMINEDALSALDLAESLQYWEVFNLLEKAGAK